MDQSVRESDLDEGVGMEVRAEKGRCAVAKVDFSASRTVLRRQPYQAVLYEDELGLRCSWCLQKAAPDGRLLRCSRSQLAWYCSTDHQSLDWKDGYKQECAAIVRCKPRVPPPTIRLAARVLLKHLREQKAVCKLSYWDSFAAIEGLVHHWEDLCDERKQTFAEMAVLARDYAYGEMAQEGLLSVKDIALLLARFASNIHTICDDELRPIGIGIYPLMSMVNHSCTPNCTQIFKGRELLFRTLYPLSNGEEITITYVDQMATRNERREQLLQNYHFDIDKNQPVSGKFEEHVIDEHTHLHSCVSTAPPFHCDPLDSKLTAIRIDQNELSDGGVHISIIGDDHDDLHVHYDSKCTLVQVWGPWYRHLHEGELHLFTRELSLLNQSLHSMEELTKCENFRLGVGTLEQVYGRSQRPLTKNVSLGRHHLLPFRIGSALLNALIKEGRRWPLALEVAREILCTYELVLPAPSPPLGMHLALVAKLEGFCGDPRNSLSAARKALDILRITHMDLTVFEEVRRIAYDAECSIEHVPRQHSLD